jgi:hypothetical protein
MDRKCEGNGVSGKRELNNLKLAVTAIGLNRRRED